jgi:hypothetical protein
LVVSSVIGNALMSAIRDRGFQEGLALGLVALPVGAVAGLAIRKTTGLSLALGGLCFVAASGWALSRAEGSPDGLFLGLAMLVVAGALSAVLPGPFLRSLVGALLAVAGAWLVVHAEGIPRIGWIQALLGVGIVCGVAFTADLDRRWRPVGVGPVFLAISVLGVYATVPDTEQALVLLGASLPLALPGLLGRPASLAGLGSAGAYGAIGLLVWVVGVGGTGRHSAIVGGVACLGLFVVEPIAHALSRGPVRVIVDPERRWPVLLVLSAGQLAIVFVCSRVAGLRETAVAAAWIAGLALVIGVVVLVLFGSTLRRTLRIEGVRA